MIKQMSSSGGSSNCTFEPDSIAAGTSHGAQVVNRQKPCLLTVTISAVKNLRSGDSYPIVTDPTFEVTIEGNSRKSQEIEAGTDENGVMTINQSFSFDVKDVKSSMLSVHVYGKSLSGIESLGWSRNISVIDLLQKQQGMTDLKSDWHELYSKDGKIKFPGKVLIQIAAGIGKPEQKVHVFVGTWNVGNAQPGDTLSSWLPTNPSYEIVAIGAQECDYLAKAPYTDCSKDWIATLRSILGYQYKIVHGFSRGQMRLVVFVRIDAEKAISEVHSASAATGVGHVLPNKGGLCISLKFWGTALCFVNCHFAAHVGLCEARNRNYREIVGKVRINIQNIDILHQFHHVFWFGDLNYRLDFGKEEQMQSTSQMSFWNTVVDQIKQQQFNSLLQFDELRKEQSAGRALHLFKEGEIRFPPTFRMKRGSKDEYDQKRMPAWCDRILCSSLPGCNIELLSYTCSPNVSTSDHKPVAATFVLTVHALPCNFLDSVDEDDKRWHIQFTSLQARNLHASDMNGYSDPYVSFIGPNLFQEVHTKVRFKTLNPVWSSPKDLPPIVLKQFLIECLEKEYLVFRVMDYDYISTDDTLGYGLIPLADAVASFKCKGTAEFNVELSHHGCPAGTLEGVMKLSWERNVAKKRSHLAGGLMERTFSIQQEFKERVLSNRMI